jgi:carbamoylphosphate synthase small subunit
MYSKCPDCRSDTYKFSTEVYICKNPTCRHVDTRLLNKMLREIGLDDAVIEKVEANLVANMI